MTQTSKRKQTSAARRAARTAADIAIGGTALAADKAIETVDQIVERAGNTLGKGRRRVEDVADTAVSTTRKVLTDHDTRAYEQRTRDELYELAAERAIKGRSSMRKAELIKALRAER